MGVSAASVENSRRLQELEIDLPHDSAIPPLGLYPKDTSTLLKRNIHSTVPNSQNGALSDEWINKMWHVYKVKMYSTIKK